MVRKGRSYVLLVALACIITVAAYLVPGFRRHPADEGAVRRKGPLMANRLGSEKSPYLLQHADNPVDWYPWGDEAFERAKREDKPIFLSIGYSTCHWCHVMEHESFEDSAVAKLMNDVFVSVKVDREERPDIDDIYMMVCQMMTGSGGWPLTIIMTPDRKPFFAATYVPKTARFGRIGMLELIPRIKTLWATQRGQVLSTAAEITASLGKVSHESCGEMLGLDILDKAYRDLADRFDAEHGGFSRAPKFPTPHNLMFLLRYWKRTGRRNALDMVEKTLRMMRRGGIYDHVGFGFHRYSTDERWQVPHFEKMLYDQALLALAYTEAYQATANEIYLAPAREILEYVLRDMTSEEGGFYSAEDADSEDEEGKFYLWTEDEIRRILGEESAEIILQVFGVEDSGNFTDEATGRRNARNILYLRQEISDLAARIALPEQELRERLEEARQRLFAAREQRVHPLKDDKILADWNGLMIAALAKAAQVFERPEYVEAAAAAADFVLANLCLPDGRLLHRYRDGEAGVVANLSDYAFLVWGLIELYQAGFDETYLMRALDLNRSMIEHFWDGDHGGFYFTPDDGENLLTRKKDIYDGAIPSGNSVAMLNLLRLARLTGNQELEARAAELGKAFSGAVGQAPAAYTQLLMAVDFAHGPSYEVVIAGKRDAADTNAMLRHLMSPFIPNKVVLLRPDEEAPRISEVAEFTRDQSSIEKRATAYVCMGYNCRAPTTDTVKMLEMLNLKPDGE
jgi:uncharacterized protein YyaL (SSP411 family)